MYTFVLYAHSWLRWILLLIAVVVVVRSLVGWLSSNSYRPVDSTLAQSFFWVLNVQFILGIILYAGLSPVIRTAFSDMAAAMRDSSIRFYVAEHLVTTILAIAAGHIGISRAKKATDDKKKHMFIFLGTLVFLILILTAIPWPNLPYGRVLFRLP